MTNSLDFFGKNQWVEVFRAGSQTSSSGYTKEWTKEDLEDIVKKYDAKNHEAPLVIGHPKDNDPAYGWVEGLKTDGKILYAKFKQVVPEFIEAVKKGLFKKRSISLYGDLTLRHIGFLGAVPPAVKGLADIKFNEDNEVIEIEFEEKKGEDNMTIELKKQIEDLQKQLKDSESSFNEQLGASKTEVEGLKSKLAAKEAEITEKETAFNEVQKELDVLKKVNEEPELTEREKEFSEKIKALELENQKQKKQNRVSEFKDFVNKLHGEGKIVSDFKSALIDIMEAIHDNGEFDFAEGKADVLVKFKDYLEKQPALVSFKEEQTLDQKRENDLIEADKKLDELARDYLEKNKNNGELSYAEALSIVQKQNPALAVKVQI